MQYVMLCVRFILLVSYWVRKLDVIGHPCKETQIYLFGFRSKVWFWLRDANDVGRAASET